MSAITSAGLQNCNNIKITYNQELLLIDNYHKKSVSGETSQSCSDELAMPVASQQDDSRQLLQGSGSVLPSLPIAGSPCADENVSCSRKPLSFKSTSMMSRAASSSSERSTSQDRLGGGSTCYPGDDEFINSEFYIDESLPSSGTSANHQLQNQLQIQQLEVRQSLIGTLSSCHQAGSFDEETIILLLQVLLNQKLYFYFQTFR